MSNEAEFLDHIEKNRGIIYKVINLYANDLEDKKDLYQEVVFQAWKSYANFRADSKFSTWLYRVSLNVSMTHLSKSKKMTTVKENTNPADHEERFGRNLGICIYTTGWACRAVPALSI